jgi:hypothetical protein
LNSKINEFYLELGVLTKNVKVMLLIKGKQLFLQTFGIDKSDLNTNFTKNAKYNNNLFF